VKHWYALVASIVWFSITDLLDVATTLMFRGSPNCVETNPFFAPFMNNVSLLSQAFFMAWFFPVAVAVFTYLVAEKIKAPWWIGIAWYWIMWIWGFWHLEAAISNYAILGLCYQNV